MPRSTAPSMLEKFHPYTGEDDGLLRFWDYQENNIQSFLDEPTNAGLIADDMGGGKMGQACEIIVRLGATRTLFIGVKETWEQFRDRLYSQSDGALVARRIDATKGGQVAFADFLAGNPGHYFAGHQYLTAQDWRYDPVIDENTGEQLVDEKGKKVTERKQIRTFRKIAPLDLVIADECFVAGTKVSTPTGEKSIEDLRVGDEVYGFDHNTNSVKVTTVTGTMNKRSSHVLPHGSTVNHPYYVAGDGYRPAGDLTEEDVLYEIVDGTDVRPVRSPIFNETQGGEILLPSVLIEGADRGAAQAGHIQELRAMRSRVSALPERSGDSILREVVLEQESAGDPAGISGQTSHWSKGVGRIARGAGAHVSDVEGELGEGGVSRSDDTADEGQQSVMDAGRHGEGARDEGEAWGDVPAPERREWSRLASRAGTIRRARGWVEAVTRRWFREGFPETRAGSVVQDRFGALGEQGRGGVRREQSRFAGGQSAGREEDNASGVEGLDDLAILEPRNPERYERVRAANQLGSEVTVYNIETGSSNYFAAGLLVHNCHIYANRKAIGRKTLITIPTERKLAMSGTWYGNRFENSHSITRWLWGALIEPNFYTWRRQWCSMQEVYVGRDKTQVQVTGEIHPGEFVKTLPCYFRHEMPKPPEPKLVYVDLTPVQRAQYDELEADLLTWLKSHQGAAPLVADLPITLRSRLRTATLGEMSFDADGEIQFADDAVSSKLHALRGVLDHYGDQPVLIYTDSKRYAKVVVKRMRAAGYDVEEYSGDVNEKQRGEIKARFLAKELQYIVAVIPAFSTGLDGFQRVASKIVWLSESDNQVLNSQAVARLHRPGMIGDFEHVKILARNTLDEKVFGTLVAAELARNASTRAHRAA